MAKRKTSIFDRAFAWMEKVTRDDAKFENLLGRDRAMGARLSPLNRDEEMLRRETARGYKISAAYRTRKAKRRKDLSKSQLRQQYKRDMEGVGLPKRGYWPKSMSEARGASSVERMLAGRKKPKQKKRW